MLTSSANRDSRSSLLSFWPRVREFAVPASMIETATARREAGDWAGACAAAGVDVDLHLRSVARDHGRDLATRIRADLRHLAPDLLRWHLPRIAPHGLLRPGLTIALARYHHRGTATGPRCIWSSGPRPPGRTRASGSASPCGTARTPNPPPAATPTRIRAGVSASTCTATSGTHAGPVNWATGQGRSRRTTGTDRRPFRTFPDGAGRPPPRRRPMGGRGGDPAPRRGAGAGGNGRRTDGETATAAPAPGSRREPDAPDRGGDGGPGDVPGTRPAGRGHLGAARPRSAPYRGDRARSAASAGRAGPRTGSGAARSGPGPAPHGRGGGTGAPGGVPGSAAPDRPGRRRSRALRPRRRRDPPRRAAGRAGRYSAALPPGHRRGAPAAGLPHRCTGTPRPRRHRRGPGRRGGAPRPGGGPARRSAAGRTGGRRPTADHLRTVPRRPHRPRPPPPPYRSAPSGRSRPRRPRRPRRAQPR